MQRRNGWKMLLEKSDYFYMLKKKEKKKANRAINK